MLKHTKNSTYQFNKAGLIIAMLHWLVSFFTDRSLFNYSLTDFSDTVCMIKSMLAWAAKGAFLILLIILWQLVFFIIKAIKENNQRIKEYLSCVLVYFLIMSALFSMLSPGLWRLDEFGILKNATLILPHFWQGYLTSIFYIFALMLIPSISGVVIVQYVIISFITGYIVFKLKDYLKIKKYWWTLYIPFLAFPVIDSNFYPIRMSIYAFLEVLLIFELFSIKYEKRKITTKNILLLSLLSAIIVCWRTEAIYYMAAMPIVFAILFIKDHGKKCVINFTVIMVIFSGALTSVQLLGNKATSGNEYDITSVVLPITPLVATAEQNGDSQILEKIDKVLSTDVITKGYKDGRTGISLFWDTSLGLVRSDYTNEDYSEFKAAYYELIKKYPLVFLKERWNTFINSNGILSETQNLYTDDVYAMHRETYNIKNEPPFRKSLIKLLEFIDYDTLHNIVYSFVIQLVVLVLVCIILLFKGQWGYAFLAGCICAKVPLIFLTAPSMLFMYYYSVYLAGNLLIWVIITLWIKNFARGKR